MSILRTYNLQNPDSSNVNIQLTQNGGVVVLDGKIGIGTTNPNRDLEVSRDGNAFIRAQNTATSTNIDIVSGNGIGYVGSQSNHDLGLQTNNIERLRVTTTGNVGIGSTIPNAKLEVYNGKIRAGSNQATQGTTILEGRYSDEGDILNILGSHYSNGATILSYGMRPKSGSSGYVSSFDNFSSGRTALEMWGEGAQVVTAPAQQTTVGSDLTSVTAAVKVNNNGDVTMRGTDSQYIEVAAFRTTNGADLMTNNGGYLSFTSIHNSNNDAISHSTSTNPTRITFPIAGMVHLNYHQDIRSGSASNSGHYDHIKVRLNGTALINSLISSTNDIWDSIHGTLSYEVEANDYIELELATNTSIVAWDNTGWSSYNFIFAPINANR
tara:strand:- start:2189 stop:3331 length:1143 start_codon:yes stop_codon:yes gene_type:complete